MLAGLLFGAPLPAATVQPVKVEAHPIVNVAEAAEIEWDKPTIIALATRETQSAHVNTEHFLKTMECETPKNSDGSWNIGGQSQWPNKRDGGREDSWGVMQIHLPDHPEITKAEAQDPAFVIPWAVNQFATGHAGMWSCWRSEYA